MFTWDGLMLILFPVNIIDIVMGRGKWFLPSADKAEIVEFSTKMPTFLDPGEMKHAMVTEELRKMQQQKCDSELKVGLVGKRQ